MWCSIRKGPSQGRVFDSFLPAQGSALAGEPGPETNISRSLLCTLHLAEFICKSLVLIAFVHRVTKEMLGERMRYFAHLHTAWSTQTTQINKKSYNTPPHPFKLHLDRISSSFTAFTHVFTTPHPFLPFPCTRPTRQAFITHA